MLIDGIGPLIDYRGPSLLAAVCRGSMPCISVSDVLAALGWTGPPPSVTDIGAAACAPPPNVGTSGVFRGYC